MAFNRAWIDRFSREILGILPGKSDGLGDSHVDYQQNPCCGHSKASHGDVGCMSIVVNPESLDEVFCSCVEYKGAPKN